MITPKGTYL